MATSDSHCIISIDDRKEIIAVPDSDCKAWIDGLAKKFESNHGAASNGTIHKVPEFLVKGNEKDYTPRLVSIGPYHLKNPELAETNKLKEQFLHNLINRSPGSNSQEKYSEALKKYFKAVRSITVDAIGKYSSFDRENIGDDELAWMMVVDGCFIIELFLARLGGAGHSRDKTWLAFHHTDVLLVENQIPFFVLEELFRASDIPNLDSLLKDVKGNSNSSFTFTQLALAYFEKDELIGASAKKFYTRDENMSLKFDHLLHLYHSIWDPSFEVPPSKSSGAQDPTSKGDGRTSGAQKPSGQDQRINQGAQQQNGPSCWPVCLFIFLLGWAVALYFLVYWIWKLLHYVVSLICKWLRPAVNGLLFFLHLAISFIVSRRSWKDLQSIEEPSLDAKNARFLHDMGIKFEMNTNVQNWLDISQTPGVLKIPGLRIHQRTIIIFRNMVAFEELNSQSRKNFTAFARFMDRLIDTDKDVAILRMCGIIQSELDEDKEVADFFNNLCIVTALVPGGHGPGPGLEEDPFQKLDSYYRDNRLEVRIRKWRMKYIPDSLRSAWAIPAIILGLIVVLPTALQTFNTIYSMIKTLPHLQQLVSAY